MAGKPLTKKQLTQQLAKRLDISQKKAGDFLRELSSTAKREVQTKGTFNLPGIGRLTTVRRKARYGRNPLDGSLIRVPVRTVARFQLSSQVSQGLQITTVGVSKKRATKKSSKPRSGGYGGPMLR